MSTQPQQPPRQRGPIFVIGCPRSGTTLLTLMLSSHSRIAIPPETRFLLETFRRRREFGDLRDRANRRLLAQAILGGKGTKLRHLGLERRTLRRTIVRSGPTLGSGLGAVYRVYAAEQGKTRWGDKRPSYVRNVEVLRELFPQAQFVHLLRDGRDCVASLKGMRWWHHGVVGAAATWVHSVDCARRAEARLPEGAFLEVRYERLVADPRAELKRLCAFLGEDFEETMLRPEVLAAELPGRQRDVWHRRTTEGVGTGRVGSHAEELGRRELALVERVAGSRLRDRGYAVGPPAGRPAVADLVAYAWTIASMRARTWLLGRWHRRLARPAGSVANRAGRPLPVRLRPEPGPTRPPVRTHR